MINLNAMKTTRECIYFA